MANFTLDMFNQIRNAPNSRLADMPQATINNLNTIKTVLNADPNAYNAYVEAMLVRIGRVIMDAPRFSNPLARFVQGENPMGHMVQEIYFTPIKAESNFNPAGPNPLGRRDDANVDVAYHQLNYQPSYVISVDRVGMMNALASWDDLDRYWSAKMQSMYTGAEIDEFAAMKKVLNDAIADTTPGMVLPSAYMGNIIAKDEASGKAFSQGLKYIVQDLGFPNTYNQAGKTNVTPREDLVLLLNKDIMPNIDVYTLASLFNSELVKLPERVITIDSFAKNPTSSEADPNANVLGVITTPSFFQFYDTLNTVRPIENPQGLFTNFFYHPWKTLQLSPFAPVVVLRSGDGK